MKKLRAKNTVASTAVARVRNEPEPRDPNTVADAPAPQTLAIRFVRVRADTVSGTLEPYRDPECGCPINTTFIGVVEDGVIEGNFTARPSHGPPYKGTWRVTRREDG